MTITIDLSAFVTSISDRTLEKLCADNPEAKFETNKDGKLIVKYLSKINYIEIAS